MSCKVTIELPLILTACQGLTMVQSLGFADVIQAAGSQRAAIADVRRRVLRQCREFAAADLVRSLVRGAVTQQTIRIDIQPEKATAAWRDPLSLRLDTFRWQQDAAIQVTYLPALDLTVLSTPQTDWEKLVAEQVRSAIRRRGWWSLVGLSNLCPSDTVQLIQDQIEVQLPTPIQRAQTDHKTGTDHNRRAPANKTPVLRTVANRLRASQLNPVYHRQRQIQQLAGLLAADPARSVLLVGPSGVGKTAIFHGWVRRRRQLHAASRLATAVCWSTDGSRLISGQCGFGMWQQQCLQMADEAQQTGAVVHLGNLVELCEAGKIRGGGGCASLLAPRLASGALQAVVECTPEQWTRIQRIEPRLIDALSVLQIDEPTAEQTRTILLEAAASKSAVAIDPEALQVLDRLHRRFRTDAAAPGRPLAMLHSIISQLDPGQTLQVSTVIAAFGRQTGLPPFLIDDSVRPDLDRIEQDLATQVLGQPAVIEALADVIATMAADLARPDRPLASLMLIGPTGVGKTETAKALARLIYSDASRLVRIDMSELSSPLAVGRLIGDTVHPEGLLTSAVRAQPFSLILLDEFEKAHASVFDLLLQVLGEGRLTDGQGRLADFRNCIVMMTSNLGVESFRATPLGLADTQQRQRYRNHFARQLREFLRPEMFNRIDRILTYDPLSRQTVQQIARSQIAQLQQREGWRTHGTDFQFDDAVVRSLAALGYQPQYGARPLTRQLERQLLVPLSEAICNAARDHELVADIRVATDADDQDQRLSVAIKTTTIDRDHQQQRIESLLDQLTTLRRRSQALQRCESLRVLRNQYTMVTRKLKALLRKTTDPDQRDKIRYGPLGADRIKSRERILAIRQLCDNVAAAEDRLLVRYYRGQPIELAAAQNRVRQLSDRLWTAMCDLQHDSLQDSQRMTLVISGANLAAAAMLINAYRKLAGQRSWNLQVHALLRRRSGTSNDRLTHCPGWSEEPAFRVATARDRVEQVLRDVLVDAPATHASMAAYRLYGFDALSSPPNGTLGLMLTFRGKHAAVMMAGEAGVHTFCRAAQPRSAGHSILIDAHAGMPVQYVAPDWMSRRDFQLNGHPRRWYDVDNGWIEDLAVNENRSVKIDRDGRWLIPLIEQETERRIWAELDQA